MQETQRQQKTPTAEDDKRASKLQLCRILLLQYVLMSLPTTEIIVFPSSEAYRSNSTVLGNALGPLSKVDGVERCFTFRCDAIRFDSVFSSIYYGLQVEDSQTGYIVTSDCCPLLH